MKKKLLTIAALAATGTAAHAASIKVDFDFGVTGGTNIADFTIQDVAITIGGNDYTFDLVLDGTLDNGSSGLRVATNGEQSILFRGDGISANTDTVVFSITDIQDIDGSGLTLQLNGLEGGSISNFNVVEKNFLADRTYIGGSANDGPTDTDVQFQLDFDSLTTSNTIDATGTGNFRMHDVDLNITAVPEPSSAALLGLGGITLILRRRK